MKLYKIPIKQNFMSKQSEVYRDQMHVQLQLI